MATPPEKQFMQLENEKKLHALYELSPLGIALTDMNGRFIDFNDAFSHICGYKKEDLNRIDYWTLTPKHYEADEVHQLESLQKTGRYGPYEKEYVRKDGSVVPVCLNGVTLTSPDGQNFIWSIVEDITQRKLAEKEIQLAATTFETLEAIIITDANETILRVNKAFTKITGFTAEEVIGNKPSMFSSGRHDEHFYRQMHEKLKTDGFWQGEVWDKHKNGQIYPKLLTISAVTDANGSISYYVGNFQDISERKESEEKIYNLAFYDALSQLPNRRLMIDRLQHALAASDRSGQYGALLYLDIDNFKHLNDTKGHHFGDLLVSQIAQRLSDCVREGDIVARFGGDEFIVMLENIGDDPDLTTFQVKTVCDKLVAALSTPFFLNGYEYHASASIGMTIFMGREKSMETLLTQADMAMYEAKKAGKNTRKFFDPLMQQSLDARVTLESALIKALPNDEFKLFYQLQVDDQENPIGIEALIRWMHPVRGLVSPIEFIPLAEENRLIVPIGKWVLQTACSQLQAWEHNSNTKNLSISINISAVHFQQDDFVDQVQSIANRYCIRPSKLKLELTESVVLGDMQATISKMEQLKALGFTLSMDDFGTGYSSLSYLKRLPFDQLKMDRSFIINALDNQNDSFLIQMVISMGAQFGMDVIAEGVEKLEQKKHLQSLGCKGFQGYFFGRPMPIEDLIKNLDKASSN